jgi:preprotein translocase subunit SecA
VVAAIKSIIDGNERQVAKLRRLAVLVNGFEPHMQALSDDELRGQTAAFRKRLEAGETLDDLLPEAFAAAREAAKRTLGQRPFDVQLMGAASLHQGMISEMKTGEGKTLTATLALYLNALEGKGAHLITTNDFLVRWQAQWMSPIFEALGLTVGWVQHDMSPAERHTMYERDVTYVQNSRTLSSAISTSPSWMKSTPSSSTRPGRL